MDVKLEKWHKCQVDKEVLKELSKKSDIKGFQHVSVFFGLLLVTGILAYQTWGTWWSVFWFLVYGNIYSFSNPLWHETGHKTAFQTKFLNEFFYYISSYMANFEPTRWRYTHFVHHGNTYSTENPFDHEIEYGNDLKETPKRLIINIIPFLDLVFFKKHISFEIIQHALGVKTKLSELNTIYKNLTACGSKSSNKITNCRCDMLAVRDMTLLNEKTFPQRLELSSYNQKWFDNRYKIFKYHPCKCWFKRNAQGVVASIWGYIRGDNCGDTYEYSCGDFNPSKKMCTNKDECYKSKECRDEP